MSQVGDTPNLRTVSDHQEGVNHRSPSTNKLCVKLIEEFTNRTVSKDKAIQESINAFQESDAHDGISAVQIETTMSTYITMLDQVGASQQNAAEWGRGQHMGSPDQQSEDSRGMNWVSSTELNQTPELEMSMGRRVINEGFFTWTREEDSEINLLATSQELTRKLVHNHTVDIKITKHNLFSVWALPEFPDSEWVKVKVLKGKAVDLNAIISVIHSTMTDNRATESFGDFELWFGHLKPTKSVKNHRDWLIVYSAFQCAMWFVYPHREGKLLRYGEYIMAYFASSDTARARTSPQPQQSDLAVVWISQ